MWLYVLILHTPLDFHPESNILLFTYSKKFVTALRNQDKKVSLIRVDEYGAPARPSEFMRIYHNMNIIVQSTGGDAYSLNGEIEIPNKTLNNIAKYLLMNSIHNK